MSGRPPASSILAGLVGGLVVAVVTAALIVAGVIDTGETTREVVRQAPIGAPGANRTNGLTVNDIYDRDGPGVVHIQAEISRQTDSPFGFPQQEQGTATGSGVVLDSKGFILTNAHVIENARDVRVRFGESATVDAEVIGTDISSDLAVLKVDPKRAKLRPIALGDSDKVNVGDPVVAIGNPFGFDRTVTTGIVSALQRQIRAPNGFSITNVIQTDASINPGNSGGPLLDARGRVIGVTSQIATGGAGSGSVGIGFAIPINTVKAAIPQLKSRGGVEHAYLGVTTASITPQIARDLNLQTSVGALIREVNSGGPADKAGLRGGGTQTTDGLIVGGDLIVKIDGKRIDDAEDVGAAIAARRPKDQVKIEYYRGSERKSVRVRLGKRPASLNADSAGGSGGNSPRSPGSGGERLPFP